MTDKKPTGNGARRGNGEWLAYWVAGLIVLFSIRQVGHFSQWIKEIILVPQFGSADAELFVIAVYLLSYPILFFLLVVLMTSRIHRLFILLFLMWRSGRK